MKVMTTAKDDRRYIPYVGKTQLGIVDKEFLKDKKQDDLLYGYIRINTLWHAGEDYYYCYKDVLAPSKFNKYFKENGERPYSISRPTFSSHLKLLEEKGWIYQDGTIPYEMDPSEKEVYQVSKLEKGQFLIVPTDTMILLVNTGLPNILKIYWFLRYKMLQHLYEKKNNPNLPKYSFSRKSLLAEIGYTKNQKNYEMMDDILDTLQKKGLLEIHTECKTLNNNIKSMFFVLDNAYDVPQEKQEQSNKGAPKADDLLVEQDETPKKEENDKISVPQNKEAGNVKPPVYKEETYDSYTDAYYKMIKSQKAEEKLKKQEEEKKREEEKRQREQMKAELENSPIWQELMNWDYK